MPKTILINGGGIAGLTTAAALIKKGFHVQVFEAASKLREQGAGLGISANAIAAMNDLGLDKRIVEMGFSVKAINIYSQNGKPLAHARPSKLNKKFAADNITIHRRDLLDTIASVLPEGTVHLDKKGKAVHQHNHGITLEFEDGRVTEGAALIAADGLHSKIRHQFYPDYKPRYSGYTAWRGVVDFSEGLNEIKEYWGTEGRVGLVPLTDGRIYWFACINSKKNDPEMRTMTPAQLASRFTDYEGLASKIINKTDENEMIWTDLYDLPGLPHYARRNVLLIGDAAHATTPNLGQGAAQAMEDGIILAHCLERFAGNPMAAFQQFENERWKRTQKIIRVSHRIGKAAQISSPFLTTLRNRTMRILPSAISEPFLKFIYDVDLEP